MLTKIADCLRLKKLISVGLILVFFCLQATIGTHAASRARPDEPSYLVSPEPYRDTYVLTQLFYASFHLDDLGLIQEVVGRGMLAYPAEFPRFMALTLELAKAPDSRLFMLLAPLAAHVANPELPADLGSVIELTGLLSPGASSSSLRDRIKFYEDELAANSPVEEAAPGRNARKSDPLAPTLPAGSENLSFVRFNGDHEAPRTRFAWVRETPDGQTLLIEAIDSLLLDGVTWGGVRSNILGEDEFRMDFFSVADGIIAFASPKNLTEDDFYADETARSSLAEDPQSRVDGEVSLDSLSPCEMRIQASLHGASIPPELTLRLIQVNAGPETSEFLCQPQCVLTYTWEVQGYALSGKACTQSDWGVWPYSDEKHRELGRARLP